MLIPFRKILSTYNLKPKGILHIGAWDGIEMDDYAAEGITNVLFIEAQQSIFETLLGRIKPYSKAKALNYCVSDKNEVVLFNCTNNGQSSSFLELGEHAEIYPSIIVEKVIEVQALTVDNIFGIEKLNVSEYDFVNIDTQGSELKVLKGMLSIIPFVKCFYIEVNEKHLYKNCALVYEVDDFLALYGFIRIETKWTNDFWGDAIYLKK